ncbi:MAG: YveK family protein [Coprococcus sp.]
MSSGNKQPINNMAEENKTVSIYKAPVEEENEIDLVDLALALFDKLHYIILSLLLGAVLFNAYAYFLIKPTYKSTSKLYIVSASEDSVVNLSDLNLGSSLTSDYEELMLSYPVLDQVIDKLNLNMDYKTLANMIVLTNPDSTRVLDITVTATSPELACDIANTMAQVSVEYLPETMSTRAPNIAQVARVATGKAGPSYMKYTIMGAILGMLVCCIFLIAGYLLDDTIHTAADMERYFGIVPLTTIPESELFRQGGNEEDSKGLKKGKHRK